MLSPSEVQNHLKFLPKSSFSSLNSVPDAVGNDLSTALDLGVLNGSLSIQEALDSTDSADVFRFTMAQSGDFSLLLNGLSADADLVLFDASGQAIAQSANSGTTEESMSGTLGAGTYYVAVTPYQDANTNYSLTLNSGTTPPPTPAADPVGNDLSTAFDVGILNSSLSIQEVVGGADPADIYRFTVNQTSQFSLSLQGMSADADVRLLDSGGQVIARSENSDAADEILNGQLAAGTYYVAVLPYEGANTNYTLTLNGGSGTTPPSGHTFDQVYGYGLVNAAAAVAAVVGQPTFADVPDLGGNNWGNDLVNAPEAWANGYAGQGITVAVIDCGVDVTHQDLSGNIWQNTDEVSGNGIDDDGNGYVDDIVGWNFAGNNNNVMPDISFMPELPPEAAYHIAGHGTHVAGTIAALNDGLGITGVAPNAQIMAIKLADVNSEGGFANSGSLAEAIYYAVNNGARVINMSLGGDGFNSSDVLNALAYAASNNVITVSAAGNDSLPSPGVPAAFATDYGVSVGAVDINRNISNSP